MTTATEVTVTQEPTLEPAPTETEIDTAAQAVAVAGAAIALAETQAAEAELDAAQRMREIENGIQEKWQTILARLEAAETRTAEALTLAQSLNSTLTATQEKAEQAEVVATVATIAAAEALTATDTTQTESPGNAPPGGAENPPARRANKLFRI